MDKWIRHQTVDSMAEVDIKQLEESFRKGERSFILLDYGEFQLIRTKIYLHDFCQYKQMQCWKVQTSNPIYSVVTRLLGVSKEDFGISKLAFYNPSTERIELFTGDVWMLRSNIENIQGRICWRCMREGKESCILKWGRRLRLSTIMKTKKRCEGDCYMESKSIV